MRRNVPALLSVVLFAALAGGRLTAQDDSSLPTLSIAPFSGNKAQIREWQPALGQCVSEMLIEALENSSGRFKVLPLAESGGAPPEDKPGKADSANGETKPGRDVSGGPAKSDGGGAVCSDFTFYGDVTQFTIQTNSSVIGDFVSTSSFANLGVKAITAHVQLQWCIMDTGTKQIIKRGTAAGFATGGGLNIPASSAGSGKEAPVEAADTQSGAGQSSVGKITAVQNSTAQARTAQTSGDRAGHKPSVNDIFTGLGKALGNAPGKAPDPESAGDNAKGKGGTTAIASEAPPKDGGEAGGNNIGALGYEDPEFMNSAFGRATSKAVANIVGELASVSLPESSRAANLRTTTEALRRTVGKVLAVAGKDTIIVSLGAKEGLKAGDKVGLYQSNDVKDDKGNVVYTEEQLVGELTLESVQEERSRASCSNNLAVQQGWIVKAK